jgi:GWxTD domain-containing protein
LLENEKEEFKLLTDKKAKQRALFKFWTIRDPKPETKVNEKMIEYDKRISFADTYFKQGMLPGWRTERGRTLLKYGFPTQRNIFPQRDAKVAAEEWFYSEIRGGVYFYFVDRLMNNTFILAHSTMPNEIFNEYWYSDYNPAIESDGSNRFRQDDRNQIRK